MRVGGRHWAAAFSGAVLVHVGLAAAILWQPPQSGAVSAGMGGIEVSLGPAGGAPGGEARPVAELAEAQAVEPTETAESETAHAEAVVAPAEAVVAPPETVAPEQTQPVETVTAEPRQTPAETVPVESATPVEVAVAEPAPVEEAVDVSGEPPLEEAQADVPQPAAETAPPRQVAAAAVVTPPLPTRRPQPPEPPQADVIREPTAAPAPRPAATATPAPRPAATATPAGEQVATANPAGAEGPAGTQTSPEAGSADAASGGGMPGSAADYMAVLQAWLERHKQYPRRAQLRRQEGTALLYFVMDRDGRVIDYRLQRSSGHDLLDREVAAMIERAQPLPRIPEDMAQDRLEVVVPVQFFLR